MRTSSTVFLVGESLRQAWFLEACLRRKGWAPQKEASIIQALCLMKGAQFDLVLCDLNAERVSKSLLISSLVASRSTLFYSLPVERGCWWLPAVREGEYCLGAPALSPKEFAAAIDELSLELQIGRIQAAVPYSPVPEVKSNKLQIVKQPVLLERPSPKRTKRLEPKPLAVANR
jgi:hypothetical protein